MELIGLDGVEWIKLIRGYGDLDEHTIIGYVVQVEEIEDEYSGETRLKCAFSTRLPNEIFKESLKSHEIEEIEDMMSTGCLVNVPLEENIDMFASHLLEELIMSEDASLHLYEFEVEI